MSTLPGSKQDHELEIFLNTRGEIIASISYEDCDLHEDVIGGVVLTVEDATRLVVELVDALRDQRDAIQNSLDGMKINPEPLPVVENDPEKP